MITDDCSLLTNTSKRDHIRPAHFRQHGLVDVFRIQIKIFIFYINAENNFGLSFLSEIPPFRENKTAMMSANLCTLAPTMFLHTNQRVYLRP